MKMETLDSGIGSRSPTPDSSSSSHSQTNSSKVTKVTIHTNHINNNSHTNTSSNGTYTNSKTKSSDKGDSSQAPTTVSAANATSGSGVGGGKNVEVDGSANDGSSGANNNQTNSAPAKKPYREYNNHNRHNGHGQYKKYGSQNHYGYNMHCQRYNGNGHHHRNYGNKHYHNNSNYHHNNNHHYHGQSYQHHHQYNQQNYHHHQHNNANNNHNSQNGSNGNGNVSQNNNSHSSTNQFPQHHNPTHMNQYFNHQQYGASHAHHSQRQAPPPPQEVFISSDAGDNLSWTRRGGESSTNNTSWSSPSLDANDSSASTPTVQITLSLPALKQGSFSPSPQSSSPAVSPSTSASTTTDSSELYGNPDDAGSANSSKVGDGGGGVTTIITTTTTSGNSNSTTPTSSHRHQHNNSSTNHNHNGNNMEPYLYPSPRGGRLMDGSLANGTNSMAIAAAAAGYPYAHFHQHPPAGFYTYPNGNHPHLGGNGRVLPHHPHMELLMPVDPSYPVESADSSISSTTSEKTVEWLDDGTFYTNGSGGNDRGEDFQNGGLTTPEYIFAPFSLHPPGAPPITPNNKKRFWNNSNAPLPGKLSPANHNQRFNHYHPRKMVYNPHGFPREFFDDLDPEDYVRAFSKFGEVKDRPKGMPQTQNDSLSEGIWQKFLANQQTTETFRRKMELWRDVYRIVRNLNFNANFKHDPRNFPTFGLQVVGSTMSGFGSNTSDVDMCLMVRETEVDQRYEAVDKLQVMNAALSATHWLDNVELIYAKVPILKFRDSQRSLEVDLNCNNFVGIRNTHLLYCYSQADWRLKPLVLVVKLWAHYHGINDAKNMTISSYSLVLMVIHFLQCGVDKPVLPVLQQEYPDKFSNTTNILHVKINEILPLWRSENTDNIGDLLTNFLEYYAIKFNYSEHAVSVRTGGTIPIKHASQHKSVKNEPHQWKYLCIEEPFDRTNTARSVYDRDTFDKIKGTFHLSYKRLLVSRNLESIFAPISEQDARTMSVVLR